MLRTGCQWKALDETEVCSGSLLIVALGRRKGGKNPTDRGKQGVKRSILTEAHGRPVGVAMAGANRHDIKLVRETLDSCHH